jgi:hypothetical protein
MNSKPKSSWPPGFDNQLSYFRQPRYRARVAKQNREGELLAERPTAAALDEKFALTDENNLSRLRELGLDYRSWFNGDRQSLAPGELCRPRWIDDGANPISTR